MNKYSSPLLKQLDAPVRFLSFSMKDLIAYMAPIFVGALFDSLFLIPVLGMGLVLSLKKLIRRFPKFYGIRFLYWSLPTHRFNRILRVDLPPSHKRLWVK